MNKRNLTLTIFILMNFVITMLALVFKGILDKISISMNISIANSGLLNTMYAYGAALGVPITLILFRKIERTKMLKSMLLLTILMTFTLIFSQNFTQLLIVRFIMGVSANSYGVLAVSSVMAISDKDKQGRSMALLIMGASLALVIGIPLTRILSSIIDWRSIFGILNAIMIFSLTYFNFNLKENETESKEFNFKKELNYFKDKNVLVIILYSIVMFVGYGALYNYITPYLIELFPTLEPLMSIILIIAGIASFLGNLIGGHISDRIGFSKSMTLGAILQTLIILLAIIFQPLKWMTLVLFIFWLMSAWFTGLQLNTGIAQVTENKSSFLLSINSSAIQLGQAIGTSIAALVISAKGIQNLIFITLITSLVITFIQIIYSKKSNFRLNEEQI